MSLKSIGEAAVATILVVCTVIVTAIVVKREFFDPRGAGPGRVPPPEAVEDWERFIAGEERLGGPTARDTIVVFSDYQCPFCKRFAETTDRLIAAYPGSILVVHRNYPLTGSHPAARPAALAGLCASRQGRFAEFHHYVFARLAQVGELDWAETANAIGIPDLRAFATCLEDPRTQDALRADSTAGEELRIPGTPLVLVNGWMFHGTPDDSAVATQLRAGGR